MPFKIIGHRGDKARYADNTLCGFKSILNADEIDGFELDVVVTKDKQLVVAHDYFIKDLENRKHYIYNLTYNKLRTLANLFFEKQNNENMRFPTLEDVFMLYKQQLNKKIILLEIKALPINNFLSLSTSELIEKIHILIKKYEISNHCYIISFDYRIIEESYRQNASLKIGQILHANLIPLEQLTEKLNIDILVMHKNWIIKEQVEKMMKKNIDIYAWAPNANEEFSYLHSIGVKGMITDKVQDLLYFKKQIEGIKS